MRVKKAVVVYFEYDDGTAEIARGEHAQQVMSYLVTAQSMNALHGEVYLGRPMEKIEPLLVASVASEVA